MVLGSHLILSAYGFWLPNDPRGSWSEFVGAWELVRFGHATKTETRRSVAGAPHDTDTRLAAKRALKYPVVCFNGIQARAIGRGFARFARTSRLTVWACAILPDHVHLVVARHRYTVEQIANLLKGAASRQMMLEGVHPLATFARPGGNVPKAFARGQWKVFLHRPLDVRQAVEYVESNPMKEGLPPQTWSFVTRYGEP